MANEVTVISTFTPTVRVVESGRKVEVLNRESGPAGPPGPRGPQGSRGERGVQNLVVGPTPPVDTSFVWIDTSQLAQ